MANITKTDLVDLMAEKGYYKYEAKNFIDDFVVTLVDLLAKEDRIILRGFGSFEVKNAKGHYAVHPKTKERVYVNGYKKITFHPGDELLKLVKK